MLDDEQHLVVMRRITQRLLRRQQLIELQIAAVRRAVAQVEFDTRFEFALIRRGHDGSASRGARMVSGIVRDRHCDIAPRLAIVTTARFTYRPTRRFACPSSPHSKSSTCNTSTPKASSCARICRSLPRI